MSTRGVKTVIGLETDIESCEEEPNQFGSSRPEARRRLPSRAARSRPRYINEERASSDTTASEGKSENEGGVQHDDPADFADDEDETRWLDSTRRRLGLSKRNAGKNGTASDATRMAPVPPKRGPGEGFQKMLRVEIRNSPARAPPKFYHHRFSSINALNQGKLACLSTSVSVHTSKFCDAEVLRAEAQPLVMEGRRSKRKASMPDITEQSSSKKVSQVTLPSRPAAASNEGLFNKQQPSRLTRLNGRVAEVTSDDATPSIKSNSEFKASSSRTSSSMPDQEAMDIDSSNGNGDADFDMHLDGVEILPAAHPPNSSKTKRVPKTNSKLQTSSSDEETSSTFKTVHDHLPPMSDLSEIFGHLTLKAYKLGLDKALDELNGYEPIKIATMCSGTESPLFAINMIQDVLKRNALNKLHFNHLFSGEIVPYKQAFIQRNFRPPVIFRDIRELTKPSGQASTAYGSPAEIPTDVDILIAGFSCVDFSRLSSKKKTLDDVGESGDTFRSILFYARTHNPSIIILENVNTAPWDDIQAIWRNDQPYLKKHCTPYKDFWGAHVAYAAVYVKLDTKAYYLPQTRQRGYMICVHRNKLNFADEAVDQWKEILQTLQRPASSSIEEFVLKDDDPRVHRARLEMARIFQRDPRARRDANWIKCQGRHQDYRDTLKLGTKRPVTHWINDGTCMAPDYWWHKWVSTQVERLWDTFELSFLRNILPTSFKLVNGKKVGVIQGFDSMSKARVWELSQNIDRATDRTPMGMTGCITPTGQPFLTTRGGPVTGLESLALQGLPIEKLVLTGESQKELQDLAGNAMSTTVVGAAILAALMAGFQALNLHRDAATHETEENIESVVPMNDTWLRSPRVLRLAGDQTILAADLCRMAHASTRLCYCEGQTDTASAPIVICKECGHTSCEKCGKLPRHYYNRLEKTRADPKKFREFIKQALPMRLQLVGLTHKNILDIGEKTANLSHSDDWAIYRDAIKPALGDELRFKTTQCSSSWSVVYEGSSSRLELVLSDTKARWQLFAKTNPREPGNSRIRQLFQNPIARMSVQGSNILHGTWEICLPITRKFPIKVTGEGNLTDSWEARLGIQIPAIADKKVWTSLRITYHTASKVHLDHNIEGTYRLLQHCGTAMGSLHKKVPSLTDPETPLFLFFDPDRVGHPNDDQFVFSTNARRLLCGELRYTVARVHSSFRPSEQEVSATTCSVFGQWKPCNASLQPFHGSAPPLYAVSSAALPNEISNGVQSVSKSLCADQTIALLSCKVPLGAAEDPSWRTADLTTVDQLDERQVLSGFAWLAGRASELGHFPNEWRDLKVPSQFMRCLTCAPLEPTIKWRAGKSTSLVKITPYEDPKQAGDYERAMKARPASFVVQTQITNNEGSLTVGLNFSTMAHRLLPRAHNVTNHKNYKEMHISWRLDTHHDSSSTFLLTKFTLKSNKDGIEAHHRFPNGELRKEQKRSLHWMINQEAESAKPFMNQDVEEATLQQLGWRAEVRVRTPQKVFGGVLADEVGYGKTATTLALIDAQMHTAVECAKVSNDGFITLKATLIVVPSHLVSQWVREARKFFGEKYQVLKIIDVNVLARTTVAAFQAADIIIVCSEVFGSPAYWSKVAAHAALPEGPSLGGRAFEAWLARANSRIAEHTEELKHTAPKDFHETLASRLAEAENDKQLHLDIPTKRLKGAKYKPHATAQAGLDPCLVNIESLSKSKPRLYNPFKKAKALGELKGPSLTMFSFHRIVVDEYTFVGEKTYTCIASLVAKNRWVLSGTPPLDDFADIHTLAGFLNIRLGVQDAANGVLKFSNIRNIRRERTAAEDFQAFGQSHSAAWHVDRHIHGQKFLDQYVRQNTAETGEIRSKETIEPVKLNSEEHAIGMELQQHLISQDMKIVRAGSAKNDGDRVRRTKALLRGCMNPEEALIKCASQIRTGTPSNNGTQTTATSACEDLLRVREKEKKDLEKELQHALKHAVWLERRCNAFRGGKKDTHYLSWKSNVGSGTFGDQDATSTLINMIKHAQETYRDSDEDLFYRNPQTQEEQKAAAEKARLDKNKSAQCKAKTIAKPSVEPALASDAEFLDGTGSQSVANPDIEAGASRDIESESSDPTPVDTRSNKIPSDDQAGFIFSLRTLSGHLRSLSIELVARERALRFLLEVCNLHLYNSNQEKKPSCKKCVKIADEPSNIFLLGSCGHVLCVDCLPDSEAGDSHCVVHNCAASAAPHLITPATELAFDANNDVCVYGSKLDAVIALIRSVPKDEQVLMFVQFDDLMKGCSSVFDKECISNAILAQSKNSSGMDAIMSDFQENQTESKKKVLMLNPANATCSGANLTNANHVIFVSPLLAPTSQQFAASYKQCIGRSKRYGQLKTVHVYKFLSLKTIDVDIQQERDGKKLVFKNTSSGDPKKGKGKEGDGVWMMLPESKLNEEQRKTDWGSGFASNSYLDEDE